MSAMGRKRTLRNFLNERPLPGSPRTPTRVWNGREAATRVGGGGESNLPRNYHPLTGLSGAWPKLFCLRLQSQCSRVNPPHTPITKVGELADGELPTNQRRRPSRVHTMRAPALWRRPRQPCSSASRTTWWSAFALIRRNPVVRLWICDRLAGLAAATSASTPRASAAFWSTSRKPDDECRAQRLHRAFLLCKGSRDASV